MKIALQATPFNRIDLFEAAGFEVIEGVCRSEQDMIDLLNDADGAQVCDALDLQKSTRGMSKTQSG